MKLAIEAEDAIIGIICGLLLLGFTDTFFTLKLSNIVYAVAFIIFVIFIVLDVLNDLMYIASYFKIVLLSIFHNLVDLVIALTLVSHFTSYNIPVITSRLAPYLQNEQILMWAGIFLTVTNTIWLVTLPFWS
jgi:hypothetical protein